MKKFLLSAAALLAFGSFVQAQEKMTVWQNGYSATTVIDSVSFRVSENSPVVTLEDIKDLKDEVVKFTQSYATCELDKAALQMQIEALMAENEALKKQIEELVSDKSAMQTQIDALSADKSALQKNVDELTAEIANLKKQIEALTADKSALQKQVETLSAQVADLKSQVSSLTADKNKLTSDLAKANTSVSNLQKENAELKQNIEDFRVNAYKNSKGYAFVDMGLPSGTLWARTNVGAASEIEAGDYFQYGETVSQSTCTEANCPYYNSSTSKFTKYCTKSTYGTVDNKKVLDLSDDAARAQWGGLWVIPTKEDWEELWKNCTVEKVVLTPNFKTKSYQSGIWYPKGSGLGYELKSNINGAVIFLYVSGYKDGSTVKADPCYYCSSTLYSESSHRYASFIYPGSYTYTMSMINLFRAYGAPVRPVLKLK